LPPGPVTSLPAYFHAYRLLIQGRRPETLALAETEIARARAAGADQAAALLLVWRGAARVSGGDPTGVDDVREAYGILDRDAHPEQAIKHAGRALAYADATANDEFRLDALALLARAHAARGEQDASRTACDAFLERWHTVGGMHHQTVALVETGVVLAADQRH